MLPTRLIVSTKKAWAAPGSGKDMKASTNFGLVTNFLLTSGSEARCISPIFASGRRRSLFVNSFLLLPKKTRNCRKQLIRKGNEFRTVASKATNAFKLGSIKAASRMAVLPHDIPQAPIFLGREFGG